MAHSHQRLHVHKFFNLHIGEKLLRYITIHFRISVNDSIVPAGLIFLSLDSPGTEVPGYSHCVPNGTQQEFSLSIAVDLTSLVPLRIPVHAFCKVEKPFPIFKEP